ncbi:hypothetical protein AB0L49_22375 [Streptomyces antimycoticus]|uniref:hypothetical protein n=1 Tax=Streptomyces antimycoticus TaxID=68175 RepID=UPI00342781B2
MGRRTRRREATTAATAGLTVTVYSGPECLGRLFGDALGYRGMLIGPAAVTFLVDTAGPGRLPLLPFVLMAIVMIAAPLLMTSAPRYDDTASPGAAPRGAEAEPAPVATRPADHLVADHRSR